MRPRLVVMLKEPRPGRVKTRLGRDIGMIRAAWWFRHQAAQLLHAVDDPRWDTVLAVSPDAEGLASRVWPVHLPRLPQGRGDLGARMARLFRDTVPDPVCIIGADVPGVTKRHVARAFTLLGRHDTVVGPAEDGGYWLIGLRRIRGIPPGFLRGVRWSTEHALADTLATMPGLSVGVADVLGDVDTAKDL